MFAVAVGRGWAALVPREWRLRLVDLNVHPLRDADLDWADAVFVSAMIVQEASVRTVIARSQARGKRVVAGGPLFTTGAERFPEVDCCVIGESEEIMPGLTADLAAGRLVAQQLGNLGAGADAPLAGNGAGAQEA